MSFPASLPAADLGRYFKVIQDAVDIRNHYELLKWLQGDIQSYLPHEIMIAAWGDFHLGLIRHDIVSNLPGVRTEYYSTELLHPFLLEMFEHWVEIGKKSFILGSVKSGFALEDSGIKCALGGALKDMRSSLIHGISDARGRHDCLYVMLSTKVRHEELSRNAMQNLLPYLDTALRQVAHLPRQNEMLNPQEATSEANDELLSSREIEIMSRVRQGKTNIEIAQILDISAFTVKNHLQRVFKKLGVFNRTQAVSKFETTQKAFRD
ncbi:MAG: transcriptional regulator EpsA [Propionivibrio sp.]|uniref:XrtB/PEP-CTERM-associated transcriptional regulator EpsA n=1 Tax=Propionivibrio sp. TaxID=2212460 RepID=UPI001A56B3A6|nr:XrtB/PEP-CTERM-associated transcriptional regulator EpsA [Propionivibrio sp.]MBL8414025.1 transcriptional regulator EpsA [Propionivibrio sp.]